MNGRWRLNRAGIFNFWYYDEEIFPFSDGKLLLRGTNGSGKSVTMQSLIPLLLDGKKSPDRLDPFGSRARRIEDYLLGEKGVVDRDERTGYLYLEYRRRGTEQTLTTGIGLRIRRNGPLQFWGFLVTDGRRIGEDFFLYKTEPDGSGGIQKIPLTRRELEARIGDGGAVVQSQREYMELVNRHLFGFHTLEAFEDLIKLLIQLRSPKLSKDFKPTVIYEILNESLPPLTDEELRPLSDTIEAMDQIRSELDQLVRERRSLDRLCRQYDQYNRAVLAEKAEGWIRAADLAARLKREKEGLQRERAEAEERLAGLERRLEEIKREGKVLAAERDALMRHDVFRAEKEKVELEQKLKDRERARRHKEELLMQKKRKGRELDEQIRREEENRHRLRKEIGEQLEEMDYLAEEAAFAAHSLSTADYRRNTGEPFSFRLWEQEARQHDERLNRVLTTLREETRMKERYAETEAELGEARRQWDLSRVEEKKWAELLEEERAGWIAAVYRWNGENREIRLDEEALRLLSHRVADFPEQTDREQLRELLTAATEEVRRSIREEILRLDHRIGQLEAEMKGVEKAIEEWRAKRDPEPPRHSDTEQARRELRERGIPFVPLYAAVEFRDAVSAAERERIESALMQMGILDALIVPSAMLESGGEAVRHDRVLKPAPHLLAPTLADYLYPVEGEGMPVSAEDVDRVLRSIRIGEAAGEETAVLPNGTYRIGPLRGHAPREEQAVYIGKEARRQYRLREIARLEAEWDRLRRERDEWAERRREHAARLERLEEEYRRFPDDKGIRNAFSEWDRARREATAAEREVDKRNEKLKEVLARWQRVKADLREQAQGIDLPAEESAYAAAVEGMRTYCDRLGEVRRLDEQLEDSRRRQALLEQNRDEVIADVDELKGELRFICDELETARLRLEQVNKRLEAMGAEAIRARIAGVERRLRELPQEEETLIRDTEKLKAEQAERERELTRCGEEERRADRLLTRWTEVFREEDHLQRSFVPRSAAEMEGGDGESPIAGRAQAVLAAWKRDGAPERDKAAEGLNRLFHQEQAALVEYRLTQQTLFEDVEVPEEPDGTGEEAVGDSWRLRWEELRTKTRRLLLSMEYEGARVSPYAVRARVEEAIHRKEQILAEKDRELFEEIILNNVGKIIRARIRRAERWVEEMNCLMEARDTSSGLTFSIRWKPRPAEHEDELDTRELVELLMRDPRVMKESDITRIATHFRTKIARAKEMQEEGENFHRLIKEILDYRRWFSFTLYCRREGEPRRELTNHVFYTFSGGEKAMAMYIPLFSAAHSRYAEARPDAPRIISLDEAFAGVDENNIRDMFDLLEELDFDYIMNSQALWGDYDTVSSLSICELVRPKNAPYVTVIRYRWNGKERLLQADAEAAAAEAEGGR